MLHKSKLMLPILAAIVGVAASAFTTVTSSPRNTNNDPTDYYWFIPSSSGETYDGLKTVATESTIRGCTGGNTVCANGYTQQQLNDPNDPSAGHQAVTPAQPLKKQ